MITDKKVDISGISLWINPFMPKKRNRNKCQIFERLVLWILVFEQGSEFANLRQHIFYLYSTFQKKKKETNILWEGFLSVGKIFVESWIAYCDRLKSWTWLPDYASHYLFKSCFILKVVLTFEDFDFWRVIQAGVSTHIPDEDRVQNSN